MKVKRIVDRFLEHSRIFIFGENEDKRIYIGSSDWMTRNLQHRIEVCIPVQDPALMEDLLNYFDIQWSDKVKAVELNEDLEQLRSPEEDDGEPGPQAKVYDYLKNRK
jgi:polyphosphate kinase